MNDKKIVGYVFALLCIFFMHTLSVHAQSPSVQDADSPVKSMGLPSTYEFSWGPTFVLDTQDDDPKYGGQVYTRLYRHLGHPSYGLGLSGEVYAQALDGDFDGGARVTGGLKLLFLEAGADYSFEQERTDFLLSLLFPLKRGGLFGKGGNFRVDWLPVRDTFNVGLHIPIGQPSLGKTRAKKDWVALPKAPKAKTSHSPAISQELETTLSHLEEAAFWVNVSVTPFFDEKEFYGKKRLSEFSQKKITAFKDHLNLRDELGPEGHSVQFDLDVYHRMVDRAFTQALGHRGAADVERELGLLVADSAREILLQQVILPYDRLLGRAKRHDTLWGYAAKAEEEFERRMDERQELTDAQKVSLQAVFRRILEVFEKNRDRSRSIWGESELVWIPLQYGLKPEQFDSQVELDRILELVTEKQFSDANDVYYVMNEQFQTELARMIHAAEEYHVLWIHDYRGLNNIGEPDLIGFRQTVESYLAALLNGVRRYDERGKMPTYLIFHDQFFYEPNQGKIWMELLQNPLEHQVNLPADYREWEEKIRQAQEELRTAVAESTLLQERTQLYGKQWLKNTVKVHVNITNPSDYSFRSSYLIPRVPFAPDDLMRDHRKISFYDVSELDPGKGEALYTGMGIGEHYAGKSWDDRAVLVRGPAILSLKDEARRLLRQQGFREDEIPVPLQEQARPSNYGQMVEALREQGWNSSVMDVQNQTGFRPKPINALKAALYSLMPKGSTIVIPDSLWNSPFWAGMLAGAAVRGCKVLVIAPALDNAPSAGFPQMSRAYELFSRLLIIQDVLREEIEAVGGMLKVGIYNRKSPIGGDSTLDDFFEGLNRYPFLKEVFPFPQDVYDRLEMVKEQLEAAGWKPSYYTEDAEERLPKLHFKVNLLVGESFQHFASQPGWADVFELYLDYRLKFLGRTQGDLVEIKDLPEELRKSFRHVFRSYISSLPREKLQRSLAYLIVGSQNQDYRGMIMDGEAACVIGGADSVIALLDIFYISGITTWVDDLETLNNLLPPYFGWKRWLGRFIMKTL